MADNWDRQYRLNIGQSGSEGTQIGEPGGVTNMPLHIEFDFERSESESSNTGHFKIYNLNDDHIQTLKEKDCVCELYAGYGERRPLVFAGIVTSVKSEIDGADISTEVELVDTRVEIRDTYVSISYTDKVNARDIIDDVANQMGVTVSYSYNAEFVDIPNGFSYIGQAKNVLTKMCNCCGLTWSIQFGVLQVKKPGDTMLREVYVLSPQTGLFGIPNEITQSESEESEEKAVAESGWEVTFLMNAAINIDDYVKLESQYADGYFRVKSIKIEGDNFGDIWQCTAQLMEVTE